MSIDKPHGGWGRTRHKRTVECGHPDRRHYCFGLCKSCYRNTQAFKDKRRAYYQANKPQWAKQLVKSRQRRVRERLRYGIGEAEYAALLERQGHVCAVCRTKGGKKGLGVDHCHRTGQVRALLCARCNLGLGFFGDDPAICRAAAQYLEDYRAGH